METRCQTQKTSYDHAMITVFSYFIYSHDLPVFHDRFP